MDHMNGAEAIGVVFRTGSGSVGSLVDGRVVWADWLAHPNGSKPEGVIAAAEREACAQIVQSECIGFTPEDDQLNCSAALRATAEGNDRG